MVSTTYITTTKSITVSSTSADASADLVYVVPDYYDSTIDMIMVTNGGTSSSKITLQLFHKDDNQYHNIIKSKSIAGNTALNVLDAARMHLHAGDKILAYKDSGTFDVTLSAKQLYNPSRA